MHKKKNYDAIIIGVKQGGVPLGMTLANAGWKTASVKGGSRCCCRSAKCSA